ncbi:pilus assembly protein TadG-related protein [Devosia ginsengisoli]|uniref:pilus assembly protein TadG-related protein n=1 Tax=Devosia ginsengisoli TaxID=400770 RepID=UPI0026ECEA88|nr:pilus assembly protein TadG-related protein [Devosia ginsengisoli]MCR6669903.1 pilus assembly protein TadG-related protein [Devosia ginsengisoli]
MYRFLALASRFTRDERGAFAVVFGLMAIVLIALGGAVVDYVALQQAKSRAQVALDAAALALQPLIFNEPVNEADIMSKAQDLLRDRIGTDFDVASEVTDVQVNVDAGALAIDAEISMPTMFVTLVGVDQLNAHLRSQATRRMLDVEVVMVLDNSGSMSGTPMNNLKTAACNAVNILFFDRDGLGCYVPAGATANPNVRIGIVPFTSLVNIGTQFSNALWLDWKSESHLAAMGYIPNFDDDDDDTTPFTGPVDRRTLFSETNTSWQGCVEARISPYDTTDDPPDMVSRHFVPLFSPDTYNTNNNYISNDSGSACFAKTCTQVVQRSCSGNKTNCNGPQSYSYTKSVAGVSTAVATSCIPSGASAASTTTTYPNNSTQVITRVYNIPLTNRERQDRLCKYEGKT